MDYRKKDEEQKGKSRSLNPSNYEITQDYQLFLKVKCQKVVKDTLNMIIYEASTSLIYEKQASEIGAKRK